MWIWIAKKFEVKIFQKVLGATFFCNTLYIGSVGKSV